MPYNKIQPQSFLGIEDEDFLSFFFFVLFFLP